MVVTFIFAGFALFAALAALWFTAEAVKRVDGQGAAMVKPHIGDLRRDLDEALDGVRTIGRRLDAIERDLKWLKARGADVADDDRQAIAARAAAAGRAGYRPSFTLNG